MIMNPDTIRVETDLANYLAKYNSANNGPFEKQRKSATPVPQHVTTLQPNQ